MFDPITVPRVFGVPPGCDYPKALVAHLRAACANAPPEALARVRIIVNTARMQRRLTDLFHDGPPALLPRIETLQALTMPEIAPASPLRRRLELARLIARLLDAQPDLAPRAALYDLADSLAALMDEMQGEDVSPARIAALDVSGHSAHWARAQAFLGIAADYLARADIGRDAQARQRAAVLAQIAAWDAAPPGHPVIVAGSTGSRATMRLLMVAVARLPQGAVVLPGYDDAMPHTAWDDLRDPLTAEDHPQARYRRLMADLGIGPADIVPWPGSTAPNAARNRLISLALRPAPVTDCWRAEGPALTDLMSATDNVTLIEAPSRRHEALAIALRLRAAAEENRIAALITPDRLLTRSVQAHLDRWRLIADDSAGQPLRLSAPGRFLRHVADLMRDRLTAALLLILLKHPLCHSGTGRGDHLRRARMLELHIRRNGMPFPDAAALTDWAAKQDAAMQDWAAWVVARLMTATTRPAPLTDLVAHHRWLAESIAAGPAPGTGGLWDADAGIKARQLLDDLAQEAPHGGVMTPTDFADLLDTLLGEAEVRSATDPDPRILIWGTLEARVQGADLVILGGLNDGVWPAAPPPDPWLNRAMRLDAGLLLPERRVGLSAHDFQQAIAAPEVWLTRSLRGDEAQTVPSRWVNRLLNLLDGLPETGGPAAIVAMGARGDGWLRLAEALEATERTAPAPRPAPIPPARARLAKLSITQIKTLVRDPYAIYAREILRLNPLDPLTQSADARLKGTALHAALEAFVRRATQDASRLTPEQLLADAETILAQTVPWPEVRMLWQARLTRIAADFVADETARQQIATPLAFEVKGRTDLPFLNFTLTGKADRIDATADGRLHLYDYKTGSLPTEKQQARFDRQLQLTAAMARRGAFEGIAPADPAQAAFLGIGSKADVQRAPLLTKDGANFVAATWDWLGDLLAHYLDGGAGFTARKQMERSAYPGDFDHLARFGEWDETTPATPQVLT